ncbi:MAG: polysaccharide deacetylase family protein [Thermodesulfobacteriota bacterium]
MNRRHFIAAMSALGALPLLPKAVRAAPERLPRGMVTFTFDDGIASNYQYALPILKSRGHLATAGIVVTRMLSGNNDYMTVDQVRELAANGWEIASHSLTHSRPIQIPKTYEQEPVSDWHADQADANLFQAQYEYERIAGLYQDGQPLKEVENLSQLRSVKGSYWHDQAIAELHVHPLRGGDPSGLGILAGSYQREMEQSKKMLTGLGFDVDTYIAPHNYWTEDVEAISRRYYKRACTGRDSDNRPSSFDPFAIRRFMAHARDSVQSYVRIIKDHCLEYGGWVVFCFHGVGDKTGWEPVSSETLDGVSSWVAGQSIPVVTIRQGCKIMEDLRNGTRQPAPETAGMDKNNISNKKKGS